MADCTRSRIPAPRKLKLSSKEQKLNLSPRRQKRKPKVRSRVDIGRAGDAWRSMKAAKGWKSDAEVAMRLIEITKTTSASPRPTDEKVKFSQSEMQALVEQQVEAMVQKREAKLQALMKTIQQLDQDVDYERTITRLEKQIHVTSRRAEAAIAFMKTTQQNVGKDPQQNPPPLSPLPSFVKVNIARLDSQDVNVKTAAQTDKEGADYVVEKGEVFMMMEHTKRALKKMKSDNAALKDAMAALSEERLTPCGSPEDMEIKPKEEQEVEACEEPTAGPVKVERLPLSGGPGPADPDQVKPLYPPLPINAFPSTLLMSAASYNIPQRPQVRLALIRNPAGLSVLWNAMDDPSKPPMASYSVYMTVEKAKGSKVFPDWTCSQVDAKPLPMCMMISKFKPGHKVCVAVVGKDKFGRFGPYSSVVTASLPE